MDIFGDDIDSMLDGVDDALNENIREDDINGNDENADDDDGDGEKKDAAPIPVEPKKRSVRKPQLRLNIERLKSERGIHTVEDYFKDTHYLGKGHEKHDLNNLMKKLEHWAHRLYPAFKFDDFILTCERLGKKKQIQTHMYRYRQGLLEPTKQADEDNEAGNDGSERDDDIGPIDELDEIIDQQIQNYTIAPPKTPGHDSTFDSIRSSVVATPQFMGRRPVVASTPLADDLGVRPLDNTLNTTTTSITSEAPRLSSDQMAKIAENRRLAQERLKAKREREAQLQREKEAQQLTLIEEEEDIV